MGSTFGYVGSLKTLIDNLVAGAKDRVNHTGTQSADTIVDGTTNKTFLATERTKLAGITAGATANRTDAATDAAMQTLLTSLVNGAPGQLDQLNELAAALGNDANFAATITAALAKRLQTWAPTTAYTAGQLVVAFDGSIVQANSGFTSGATFNAANWTVLVPTATQVAATYPAMRATAPSSADVAAGVVAYIDKSVVPPVLKGWDGTTWVVLGGTSTTPVTDGVLLTESGDFFALETGDLLLAA